MGGDDVDVQLLYCVGAGQTVSFIQQQSTKSTKEAALQHGCDD